MNKNGPILVIEGVAYQDGNNFYKNDSWRKEILKYSLSTMILAAAADHRQYPDPVHDDKIDKLEDSEYSFYKAFARANGFSSANPSTFFVQHIYTTSIRDCSKSSLSEKYS